MNLAGQRVAGRLLLAGVALLVLASGFTGCAPQNIGPYNETWFRTPGPRISNAIWQTHDDWYRDIPYWNLALLAEEYEPIPGPMPSDLREPMGDYIVGPGDLLQITVLDLFTPGEPYVVMLRVSEIGNISLPYISSIRVAGYTLQGIEERIADMLRAVIREPRVTVFLSESRNRFYSVLGGVRNPNIYPLVRNNMTILDAIAAASGTLPFVDEWAIVIRNFTPEELNTMLLEIYASRGQTPPADGAVGPLVPAAPVEVPAATEIPSLPASPEAAAPVAPVAPVAPADGPTELELMQRMAEGQRIEVPVEAAPEAPVAEVPAAEAPAVAEGDAAVPPPAAAGAEGRWVFRNNVWVYEGPTGEPVAPPVAESPAEFRAEEGLASLPADIRAELTRRGVVEGGGQLQRVFRVNVPLARRGDVSQMVILQHNDKIDILEPPAGEFYMDGEVVRRGVYSLTGRQITVLQAVAAAGGLTQLAIPKRGMLTRRVGPNKEETIYFDLAKIANGEAPDFFLQPNDLIRIGTDQGAIILAVLRNAFRATYGFGLVYDQNFADIYPWKGEIHPLF